MEPWYANHLRELSLTQPFRTGPGFLSCLFGSEQTGLMLQQLETFLSCLFGSEQSR